MRAAIEVELWTDWQCNGGTALGVLLVLEGTYGEHLDNTDACTLTVVDTSRVAATVRQVARFTDALGQVFEYRLHSVSDTLADGRRTLKGLSPLADLGTTGLVYEVVGGVINYAVGGRKTPADMFADIILTHLVEDGVDYFDVGTIEPTAPETLNAPDTGWTRLEWANNLKTATGYELRVRRNGATNFLIDLVAQVGASAATLLALVGKNLLALSSEQDDAEMATAITVLGEKATGASAPAGIGENGWELGTIPGGAPYWIPVTDPDGGDGPVAFAAQFGTAAGSQAAYLLRSDGGTTQILDSRITPDNAVRVAATTGLTAGHHVQFVADASGTRLGEVRTPNVARLHRRDTVALRGERNLLRNGQMLDWTNASTPALWSAQGGTVYVGEYLRDTPASITGLVCDGALAAFSTSVNFRGAAAGQRLYYNEYFTIGVTAYRVGNAVVTADGAGKGTITFLTGSVPSLVADGTSLVFGGSEPTRPSAFPSEPDEHGIMRLLTSGATSLPPSATALRMQSEGFTVKYIAGELAQLNVRAGFTVYNGGAGGGGTVGNKDGGGAITEALASVVTRNLPGLMLRDSAGPTRLAWTAVASAVSVGETLNETVSCSTTLTADTAVDVCLLPGDRNIWQGCRWVMLWLGPTSDADPGFWGNKIWQYSNRALLARGIGSRQMRMSLRHLASIVGYSSAREQLTLGGWITDEFFGVTVRVLGVLYDAKDPTNIDVILDARPKRLARFLAESL